MSKHNLLTLLFASTSLLACTDDAKQPDQLALPGQAYFPESLNAGADGTIYVGSLATGQVVAFDDGAKAPRTAIAAGQSGVTGVTGVLATDDTLWICSVDTTFSRPTEVRSFTLTGEPKASYPLAASYFCNDLAFDKQGNLYATDSFSGSVQRLKAGGAAFETYVQDARLAPATQGAFGLDGIVIGDDAIYVNKLDSSQLFRIGLGEDKAITEITVTPPLAGPDGMRALDAQTLLVIDGAANRLSKVEIHGATATSTPLSSDLDMPTGVAVSRGSAWVSEGQLGRLFTGQNPNLPFSVTRVAL
jgi:sugar lactone lactonase YvrE